MEEDKSVVFIIRSTDVTNGYKTGFKMVVGINKDNIKHKKPNINTIEHKGTTHKFAISENSDILLK